MMGTSDGSVSGMYTLASYDIIELLEQFAGATSASLEAESNQKQATALPGPVAAAVKAASASTSTFSSSAAADSFDVWGAATAWRWVRAPHIDATRHSR